MAIPVTLTLAAACAVLNLWLMVRVGGARRAGKVSIGDGGDEMLIRRMRAQANFVENAPFVLALVLAIELATGSGAGWYLWAAAALFVIARLAHPFGMDGVKYARMLGTLLSMLVLAGLAGWAATLAYGTRTGMATFEPIQDDRALPTVESPRG